MYIPAGTLKTVLFIGGWNGSILFDLYLLQVPTYFNCNDAFSYVSY